MKIFTKNFAEKAAERAFKTAVQVYLVSWGIFSGVEGETPVVDSNSFDLLFTVDNVKAAVAGAFLSLASSVLGKNLGNDSEDPSLV